MIDPRSLYRDEEGQDVIEYGLLAAFISIGAVLTLKLIGPLVNNFYITVKNALT